jgi:hypothetical protein
MRDWSMQRMSDDDPQVALRPWSARTRPQSSWHARSISPARGVDSPNFPTIPHFWGNHAVGNRHHRRPRASDEAGFPQFPSFDENQNGKWPALAAPAGHRAGCAGISPAPRSRHGFTAAIEPLSNRNPLFLLVPQCEFYISSAFHNTLPQWGRAKQLKGFRSS